MKVTNKTSSPQVVYAIGGRVTIPARGTYEGEFADGEAKNIASNTAVFVVDGAADTASADRAKLNEIAALFGTPDVDHLNVKAAVERLIQDQKKTPLDHMDDHMQRLKGMVTPGTADLSVAIAMLDDANDDHWTQAGLPDIATLKTLTGGDVTRAMVDALPDSDKRERVK